MLSRSLGSVTETWAVYMAVLQDILDICHLVSSGWSIWWALIARLSHEEWRRHRYRVHWTDNSNCAVLMGPQGYCDQINLSYCLSLHTHTIHTICFVSYNYNLLVFFWCKSSSPLASAHSWLWVPSLIAGTWQLNPAVPTCIMTKCKPYIWKLSSWDAIRVCIIQNLMGVFVPLVPKLSTDPQLHDKK